MVSFKELVGSIIDSFLGPNKSNKVVVQDRDSCITRCSLHILQCSHIQDPLSSLVEETLFAHHELYGCSTLSLLAMWYFWYEEFKFALDEGYEIQDIIMHSQDTLELAISSLSGIIVSLDSMLVFKTYECEKITQKIPFKKLNAFGQAPISVLYSSRHFSPSPNILHSEEDSGNDYRRNSKLDESSLKTVIQRLDHDEDSEMSNLLFECWKRQISFTNCSKFQLDGLLICPIILPCSNSTVVDGLIIKSNSNHIYQDMKNAKTNRILIVKGSITFEHIHLGFSPKVLISVHKTSDSSLISNKENWRRKCCEFILHLRIDVLLIQDGIDPEIAEFCLSHSIIVLPHIPLKIFKVLCHTLQYSPCTYIWDCNELPFQTIVLCHPSQAVLKRTEHQVWHLASRLNLSFLSKKLLPGGEVEDWCSDFLRKCPQFCKTLNPKTRMSIALANGFQNYSKIVSSKRALSSESTTKILDEMTSKLSAWRSALSLVLLALQCDTAIINGIGDLTRKQTVNLNVNTL